MMFLSVLLFLIIFVFGLVGCDLFVSKGAIDKLRERLSSVPVVEVLSPFSGAEVRSSYDISGVVVDKGKFGIKGVYVKVREDEWKEASVSGSNWIFSVSVSVYGYVTNRVYAEDKIGNRSDEKVLVVEVVDIPVLVVSNPADGYVTNVSVVSVNGSASINLPYSIAKVEYEVNGGGWNEASGTTNWSFTANLVVGTNVIRVRAVGSNNKTNQVEIRLIREKSVYVSVSGNDNNDGYSADKPVKSIGLGIEKAVVSNISLVKVGIGVYKSGDGLSGSGSGVYVTNISDLTIEGGYDSSFGNVVGYSELDGNGSLYHVIFISNSVKVGVKNLVIKGGNASGSSFPDNVGGGVLIIGSSGITLTNVVISNNSATNYGGGICLENSHTNIILGSVLNNSATYFGGGIYLVSSHNNIFSSNVVSNSANYGGGIYLTNSHINTLSGSVLNNSATTYGGGICLVNSTNNTLSGSVVSNSATNGGGIFLWSSYNNISGNVLNNSATNGGGIYLVSSYNNTLSGSVLSNSATYYGGGIFLWSSHNNTLSGSVVSNSANYGGGIFLWSSHNNTLSGSVVSNSANYGGGIFLWSSHNNTLSGSVVSNSANNYGGGIYLTNSHTNTLSGSVSYNSAATNGGGIYLWGSHTNVIQGEVSYNYASFGGGIYLSAVTNMSFTPALTNKANTNYGIYTNTDCSGITGLDSIMWGSGALSNVPGNVN